MIIDDEVLPAVSHLVGPGAEDVLRAVVRAAAGSLRSARVSQVQYRPGRELVVSYRCEVQWSDGRCRSETLLAATTQDAQLPGTVPVVTDESEGSLHVSVWRYPFDPMLLGLADAVAADRIRSLLSLAPREQVKVEVVAYRPTERAVVRVEYGAGHVVYIKALRPDCTEALVRRHILLRSRGVPVPEVLEADTGLGLVVLAELPGPTLRERIKSNTPLWPDPSSVLAVQDMLGTVPPAGLTNVNGRVRDALGHARLLNGVVPQSSPMLSELADILGAQLGAVDARSGRVIHGDLHEGQMIIDDEGDIVGILDVDELGPGDPFDDLATLIAHLRFRAMHAGASGEPVRAYSDRLLATLSGTVDADALALSVAAVLVGLATGPFRIQQPGWPHAVEAVIADALSLALSAGRPCALPRL